MKLSGTLYVRDTFNVRPSRYDNHI